MPLLASEERNVYVNKMWSAGCVPVKIIITCIALFYFGSALFNYLIIPIVHHWIGVIGTITGIILSIIAIEIIDRNNWWRTVKTIFTLIACLVGFAIVIYGTWWVFSSGIPEFFHWLLPLLTWGTIWRTFLAIMLLILFFVLMVAGVLGVFFLAAGW